MARKANSKTEDSNFQNVYSIKTKDLNLFSEQKFKLFTFFNDLLIEIEM